VDTGLLAAAFADVDRYPPVFDPTTGSVTVPASLRESYRILRDGEWWQLGLGDVLIGRPPLRQAGVAMTAPTTVLPRLGADRAVVETADNAPMDLPEAAF
jgi:hypothetical protein